MTCRFSLILLIKTKTLILWSYFLAVVQRRRGCILSATGTVSGFEAWSVDGMDFMTFDPESRRWTSQSSSAVTVERRWNRQREMNVAFSWFIRERCPQMIQMIKLRSIIPKTGEFDQLTDQLSLEFLFRYRGCS